MFRRVYVSKRNGKVEFQKPEQMLLEHVRAFNRSRFLGKADWSLEDVRSYLGLAQRNSKAHRKGKLY